MIPIPSEDELERMIQAHKTSDFEKALQAHTDKVNKWLAEPSTAKKGLLPTEPKARKKVPLWSGLVKYFPDALVAVAAVSYAGNEQHNPGQPLHWARGKSMDQEDTLMRHLFESGSVDVDGHRHSAKMAWRALAILQLEIEKERNANQASTD